eukprot:GILK01012628.1.p1 GENE.GILK01012628.1~~GILK01012628.1.p1  ORF type:complete len:370 (+),score=56.44 GILK01012628.1:41-1111(+)
MSDPRQWSNEDVGVFLEQCGLSAYVPLFKFHAITGRDLLELSEDQLKTDLHLQQLHDRLSLLRSLDQRIRDAGLATVHIYFHCSSSTKAVANRLDLRLASWYTYTFADLESDCRQHGRLSSNDLVQFCDTSNRVWSGGLLRSVIAQSMDSTLTLHCHVQRTSTDVTDVNHHSMSVRAPPQRPSEHMVHTFSPASGTVELPTDNFKTSVSAISPRSVESNHYGVGVTAVLSNTSPTQEAVERSSQNGRVLSRKPSNGPANGEPVKPLHEAIGNIRKALDTSFQLDSSFEEILRNSPRRQIVLNNGKPPKLDSRTNQVGVSRQAAGQPISTRKIFPSKTPPVSSTVVSSRSFFHELTS